MNFDPEYIEYSQQTAAEAASDLIKARAEYVRAWMRRYMNDVGSNEPEQEATVLRRLLEGEVRSLSLEA